MRILLSAVAVLACAGILCPAACGQEDLGPTPERPKPPEQSAVVAPTEADILAEEAGEKAGAAEKAADAGKARPAVRPGVPRVAVLPFINATGSAGAPEAAARSAAPVLVNLLVNSGRADVVERRRLEEVIAEVNFGQSGLVEPGTAVKMGKLLGVTHIVTGTIQRADRKREVIKAYGIESTKDTYNVTMLVRAVDGASGRIVYSEKASQEQVEIITQYTTKSETDIMTPLAEDVLQSVVGALIDRIAPQKKDVEKHGFRISSVPNGADVEIDGLFEGNCPLETDLEIGVHTVKVSLPGFEEWEKKVRISGKTKPMVARLREKTTSDTNVSVNVRP
ncbi:MAG: PEGA domain-containing protein [Planctomycetes bacterium]|nr:PEGA domain-containing protein [Planctomycetota bacterium]